MADPARARKIADRIQELIAANLQQVVKDPDLGFVTITDVRVTGDLQHASVFYTVFGDDAQRERSAAVLEANRGKLRSFVGKQLGIRLTPTLEIIPDAVPENASHIDDLLRSARERDADLARSRSDARPAGEADPYRSKDGEGEDTPPSVPGVSEGLVVVDKPSGWSSHDVVARCRRLYRTKKVGHAGTLDPMATGVLVLGVGRGTKLLTFLVGADKEYTATIRLGQATVTDDAEGEVTSVGEVAGIDRAALDAAVGRLTGDIEQVPSSVSAIKVKGERSYARVRAGEDVQLPARPVTVSRFDVLDVRQGEADGHPVLDVDVVVEVSSGTYVRALARDLGEDLGSRGHLTALRRTRVGGLTLEHGHSLDALTALREAGGDDAIMPLTPLEEAARAALVARELTEGEARALGYGQRIESAEPGRSQPVAAFSPAGVLVAVLDESRATARAHVVFAPASS